MPEATVSAGFCEGKADHRPAKCRNANRQGRTLRSWLSNIRGPDACLYRRHGRAVRRTFRLTGPFAIREAQAAGTVSTSISGSVADTCRGGIDTFSFPDCRHSLGGAASIRLISPAASVYAVSRDVEVQDALVFARRNLHEPLSVDLLCRSCAPQPAPVQSRVSCRNRAITCESDRESQAGGRRADAATRAAPDRSNRKGNRFWRPGAHAPSVSTRLWASPAGNSQRFAPTCRDLIALFVWPHSSVKY
jgi:hypothetical protein